MQMLRLFRAFEAWARQIGAKRLHVGHLVGLLPEKFERFYRRNGYALNEIGYSKVI